MIQAYLWTCTLRSSCDVEGQCGHSVARFRLAAMCQMGVATCWAGARGINAFFVFHSAPSATACCQRDALSTDRLRPGSAVVTPPSSSDDSSSSSTASNAPTASAAATPSAAAAAAATAAATGRAAAAAAAATATAVASRAAVAGCVSRVTEFAVGARVEVFGLAIKPELNGRLATVRGFDTGALHYGCYLVQVEGSDGTTVALKPARVRRLQPARPCIPVQSLTTYHSHPFTSPLHPLPYLTSRPHPYPTPPGPYSLPLHPPFLRRPTCSGWVHCSQAGRRWLLQRAPTTTTARVGCRRGTGRGRE